MQLRFAYRQASETGQDTRITTGIDDVVVSSNNVANDVKSQVTNGDVFGVGILTTPFEQAIARDGGLIAGVMYKNVGTDTQYNVDVLVETSDADSLPISSTTTTIDTLWSYEALTCPANSQDALRADRLGTNGNG